MPEPTPPMTASELLDCFDTDAASEMVAQLCVDTADLYEGERLWYFAGLRARWLRWGVQPR
jgi:hypothetical protein